VASKALHITMVLFGAEDKRLDEEYYWDREKEKAGESVKFLSPDFDGNWDDVKRVTIYVEPR
jgi:hypothetical protein